MASSSSKTKVAIVGGDSLLARELRDLLGGHKPAPEIELVSAAPEGTSMLSAELNPSTEEALIMSPLAKGTLDGSGVVFLAGTASSSRRAAKLRPADGVLIDLAAGLEDLPEARLRAPSAEAPGHGEQGASVQVIAHPGAIALTMFLARLSEIAKLERSIVHVFEPASERGQKGIEELQKQTVAILSFKSVEGDVFDTQLAFNLLAAYGEEALEPLDSVELRLERHLASLLAGWPAIPMPSLRMIQAPVFHGHSMSIWVEFAERPDLEALAKSLSDAGLDVRHEEPPANAAIAGHSGLSVGAITPDRNHPTACWFWLVNDNLRLAAENAIAVREELL